MTVEALTTRTLGRTGYEITTVGFGAWAAGGPVGTGANAVGWSGQDDSESVAAIRRAVDCGVSWIDTAPIYGLGHSEEIVARALHGMAERPLVFTKCGFVWDESGEITQVLERESIREQIERSLQRLEVDVLDLVQIHWPMPDERIEEGWTALAELKQEGKVLHIGVSNFSVEQLRRVGAIAPVETLQPPYSLLDRDAEREILPFAGGEDIGVIVWGPIAHGLLTGAWTRRRVEALPEDDFRRQNNQHFAEPAVTRNLAFVERMRALAEQRGRTLIELALGWVLRDPYVTGAIVGLRRPEQVDEIVRAAQVRLEDDELAEIEASLAQL